MFISNFCQQELKRQENYLFIIRIKSYLLFERLYLHHYAIVSSLYQWHRIVLKSQGYGSSQLLLGRYISADKNKVCRISSWSVNNKPEKLGGPLNDFQPHRWYSSFIEQCSLWQSSQGIQRLLEEFAAKICIVSCKTHLLFYIQPHNTKPKQLKAKHEGKRKIYMVFVYTIFSCFPKSGTKMQLMHISIWHSYCG